MAMKEIKITDFEGLQIGNAENTEAATGCTVLLFGKDGAPAGLDVRGGGPASRESELLKPMAAAQIIHAILLSGGSAFGLDAAKVSAASGGNSEPKQGQRSQSARGFCPRSTMRVPQPDIIEHFGNTDAVPQPPERCLSRKAGIVRCCLRLSTSRAM